MLKVEPKFRLDRTYRGPYRVLDVTSTNAVIQQVNDPSAQKLNVSLQRLSKCDRELSEAIPWMGHGKTRRRRQIKRVSSSNQPSVSDAQQVQSTNLTVTRKGRVIRPPSRFNLVASPMDQPKERGEVVRHGHQCTRISGVEDHETGSLRETQESGSSNWTFLVLSYLCVKYIVKSHSKVIVTMHSRWRAVSGIVLRYLR